MRLNRSSTRFDLVGFASEKSTTAPRSVGVMKRMRLPVETCFSSISLVTARSAAKMSLASASERSSDLVVTPVVPAI